MARPALVGLAFCRWRGRTLDPPYRASARLPLDFVNELTMLQSCLLALTLAAPGPKESPFPLWTDPPPKEWNLDEINNGLPYRWEKGTVHVLAWEVIVDDRPHEFTQILVFKRFDQPTEKDGHRWVLAHSVSRPKGQGVAMARADADPRTAATRREDAQPDRRAALGL